MKWKYLIIKNLKNNTSCKSLYVPRGANAIINGKSVLIGTGIKGVDPQYRGKSSLFGPHPYTCDAQWNQRFDLKDVLNKRKKSRLIKGRQISLRCLWNY